MLTRTGSNKLQQSGGRKRKAGGDGGGTPAKGKRHKVEVSYKAKHNIGKRIAATSSNVFTRELLAPSGCTVEGDNDVDSISRNFEYIDQDIYFNKSPKEKLQVKCPSDFKSKKMEVKSAKGKPSKLNTKKYNPKNKAKSNERLSTKKSVKLENVLPLKKRVANLDAQAKMFALYDASLSAKSILKAEKLARLSDMKNNNEKLPNNKRTSPNKVALCKELRQLLGKEDDGKKNIKLTESKLKNKTLFSKPPAKRMASLNAQAILEMYKEDQEKTLNKKKPAVTTSDDTGEESTVNSGSTSDDKPNVKTKKHSGDSQQNLHSKVEEVVIPTINSAPCSSSSSKSTEIGQKPEVVQQQSAQEDDDIAIIETVGAAQSKAPLSFKSLPSRAPVHPYHLLSAGLGEAQPAMTPSFYAQLHAGSVGTGSYTFTGIGNLSAYPAVLNVTIPRPYTSAFSVPAHAFSQHSSSGAIVSPLSFPGLLPALPPATDSSTSPGFYQPAGPLIQELPHNKASSSKQAVQQRKRPQQQQKHELSKPVPVNATRLTNCVGRPQLKQGTYQATFQSLYARPVQSIVLQHAQNTSVQQKQVVAQHVPSMNQQKPQTLVAKQQTQKTRQQPAGPAPKRHPPLLQQQPTHQQSLQQQPSQQQHSQQQPSQQQPLQQQPSQQQPLQQLPSQQQPSQQQHSQKQPSQQQPSQQQPSRQQPLQQQPSRQQPLQQQHSHDIQVNPHKQQNPVANQQSILSQKQRRQQLASIQKQRVSQTQEKRRQQHQAQMQQQQKKRQQQQRMQAEIQEDQKRALHPQHQQLHRMQLQRDPRLQQSKYAKASHSQQNVHQLEPAQQNHHSYAPQQVHHHQHPQPRQLQTAQLHSAQLQTAQLQTAQLQTAQLQSAQPTMLVGAKKVHDLRLPQPQMSAAEELQRRIRAEQEIQASHRQQQQQHLHSVLHKQPTRHGILQKQSMCPPQQHPSQHAAVDNQHMIVSMQPQQRLQTGVVAQPIPFCKPQALPPLEHIHAFQSLHPQQHRQSVAQSYVVPAHRQQRSHTHSQPGQPCLEKQHPTQLAVQQQHLLTQQQQRHQQPLRCHQNQQQRQQQHANSVTPPVLQTHLQHTSTVSMPTYQQQQQQNQHNIRPNQNVQPMKMAYDQQKHAPTSVHNLAPRQKFPPTPKTLSQLPVNQQPQGTQQKQENQNTENSTSVSNNVSNTLTQKIDEPQEPETSQSCKDNVGAINGNSLQCSNEKIASSKEVQSKDASMSCPVYCPLVNGQPESQTEAQPDAQLCSQPAAAQPASQPTNNAAIPSSIDPSTADSCCNPRKKTTVHISQRKGGLKRRHDDGAVKNSNWQWVGNPTEKLVFTQNDAMPVKRNCYKAMRHVEGDIISVRDCVLLKSGPSKHDLPYIAKISALYAGPNQGEMLMSLLWYYRPEQADLEKRPASTEDELYASKHRDENNVACIDDKCYVLTPNEYARYRQKLQICREGIAPETRLVPETDKRKSVYPYSKPIPAVDTDRELVFFCARVYDFRQKRLLKNPY